MTALSPVLKQATGVLAARGEGAVLYDEDNRRYLDFTAGIGARGGTVIACADDPGSRDVAEEARRQGTAVVLYGTAENHNDESS